MHPLLEMLKGGDRRSIGRANDAAARVLKEPALIDVLFTGMRSEDAVLRMRCADAVEKVTAEHPEYLLPYKRQLLGRLAKIEQAEVRWHVAPMLSRLPLSKTEQGAARDILTSYTDDRSSIVRTFAMQALCDLGLRYEALRATATRRIEALTAAGTPAMRARGKKLLLKLKRAEPPPRKPSPRTRRPARRARGSRSRE